MTHPLIENLKAFNPPPALATALGALTWTQRLAGVTEDGGKTTLRFYSDGLDLKTKATVETWIKERLGAQLPAQFVLYFERLEKNSTAPSTPAAQTPGHSHPHTPPKPSERAPSPKRPIPGVKRIVAVASGKGGVGKSTVSVNLALALSNQGLKVGLLDADIYGPSLPMMLGIQADPSVNSDNQIVPPVAFGLKVMSFGFFAGEDNAVIWRGPMLMKALQQFFYDVDWGELDVLVIDLPPGTGDAHLTLVQSLPLSGAVIVTTPQNVALLDAYKGVMMFEKTQVPVLGIVENMATFHCPSCGSEHAIFGEGGADRMGKKFDVPVLGHIPLLPAVREAGDNGTPLAAQAGHPIRVRFAEIAEAVMNRLAQTRKA